MHEYVHTSRHRSLCSPLSAQADRLQTTLKCAVSWSGGVYLVPNALYINNFSLRESASIRQMHLHPLSGACVLSWGAEVMAAPTST